MRRPGSTATLLVALTALWACSAEPEAPSTRASEPPPAAPVREPASEAPELEVIDLVARGRRVYVSNCIACHNTDPSQDGALGPAVAGSSQELLEARVIRNEYPAGYTPKRDSKAMIALPYLAKELPAIQAFLAPAAPN